MRRIERNHVAGGVADTHRAEVGGWGLGAGEESPGHLDFLISQDIRGLNSTYLDARCRISSPASSPQPLVSDWNRPPIFIHRDINGLSLHDTDDDITIAVSHRFDDDADGYGSPADFGRSRVEADQIADKNRRNEIDTAHCDSDEEFVGVFPCFNPPRLVEVREDNTAEYRPAGISISRQHRDSNGKVPTIVLLIAHRIRMVPAVAQFAKLSDNPRMSNETIRKQAVEFFSLLQDKICRALEAAEGNAVFYEDQWQREGGGGGRTRIIEDGAVFEKAGVNFSAVAGLLPEEFADKIGEGVETAEGREFFATGISLVLHPHNPFIPTVHANFRYLEKGQACWFGGGSDLTPYYPAREDVEHFHRAFKNACDKHDRSYYLRFKKWCDEYFLIKHRGETRGVGGIFFDYLQGDLDKILAFVKDVGEAFLPAYLPILERHRDRTYGTREREFQLIRRGRYAEFNLVYDRGTVFGLETRGRTESILMSLPPLARWVYNYMPEPNTPESEAWSYFKAQDWLSLES